MKLLPCGAAAYDHVTDRLECKIHSQQCFCVSDAGCDVPPCSDALSDAFISVGGDVQDIMDKLSSITTKLDQELLQLRTEASQPETPEQHKHETNHPTSHDPAETDSRPKQDAEDGGDGGQTMPLPGPQQASDSRSSDGNAEEKEEESLLQSEASSAQDRFPGDGRTDLEEQTRPKVKDKEGTSPDWITVG